MNTLDETDVACRDFIMGRTEPCSPSNFSTMHSKVMATEDTILAAIPRDAQSLWLSYGVAGQLMQTFSKQRLLFD